MTYLYVKNFDCRNSTFDQAVKLRTSDENELTADSDSRLSYTVTSDDCQVKTTPNYTRLYLARWLDFTVCGG